MLHVYIAKQAIFKLSSAAYHVNDTQFGIVGGYQSEAYDIFLLLLYFRSHPEFQALKTMKLLF